MKQFRVKVSIQESIDFNGYVEFEAKNANEAKKYVHNNNFSIFEIAYKEMQESGNPDTSFDVDERNIEEIPEVATQEQVLDT